MDIKSTGKLLNYKDFLPNNEETKAFLETGSAAGDGVQRALDAGFNVVVSVEASKQYYEHCCERFKRDNRVTILLGKSIDVLASMDRIPQDVVIFLDAHVSGETSAGYEDWVKNGEDSDYAQDKTIKAELKIILEKTNANVIIIDDVNGLTDGHAEEYAAQILEANPGYQFYFYDENLSGKLLYKDKILVAVPQWI